MSIDDLTAQVAALSADVERMSNERMALEKRCRRLERENVALRAEHEVATADVARSAALRADVARILSIVSELKERGDGGEA